MQNDWNKDIHTQNIWFTPREIQYKEAKDTKERSRDKKKTKK